MYSITTSYIDLNTTRNILERATLLGLHQLVQYNLPKPQCTCCIKVDSMFYLLSGTME